MTCMLAEIVRRRANRQLSAFGFRGKIDHHEHQLYTSDLAGYHEEIMPLGIDMKRMGHACLR